MQSLENLIEFDVIIYYNGDDEKSQQEIEKYLDMGMEPPEPDGTKKEEIVKYYFDCSDIKEIRETKITYEDNWRKAIVVTFSSRFIVTPPLLCTIEEFKARINEHYQKNIKA